MLGIFAPLLLSGCQGFFVCEGKASCPSSGSGSGSGSGDYVYVSNAASGSTYLAGYDLSDGKLTALSNFPYPLGYVPVALSVAPSNKYLYAATLPGVTNPGIYQYTIGSDGSLSGGSLLITEAVSSMDISPDGNYLFVVDTDGLTMNEYSVVTSTGALSLIGPFSLPNTTGATCVLPAGSSLPASQSCTVKVAPGGAFVVVAMGTAGDAIFPYSSSSGITGTNTFIPSGTTSASPTGDYSVAMDKNNYAYVARTNVLAVYSIASNGAATQQFTQSYTSGTVPRSVTLSYDPTTGVSSYVYTANEGASTISGFTIGSTGGLTQLGGSPFAAPANVSALGVDNTGKYLVAAGYDGTSGVELYSLGSSGTLSLADKAGSGTSTAYPAILALTH